MCCVGVPRSAWQGRKPQRPLRQRGRGFWGFPRQKSERKPRSGGVGHRSPSLPTSLAAPTATLPPRPPTAPCRHYQRGGGRAEATWHHWTEQRSAGEETGTGAVAGTRPPRRPIRVSRVLVRRAGRSSPRSARAAPIGHPYTRPRWQGRPLSSVTCTLSLLLRACSIIPDTHISAL